jgi:hypothetical protein
MAESDDGFVSRWSKRKRAVRDPEPAEPPAPASGSEPAPEAGEADIVAELPDVDSLDESSDFSVFLQEGVPDAIRRKALRRLWRLNPLFANLDGLNDYDEDFTDAATVVEGLKTLYQAGKGIVDPDEGKDEEETAAAVAPEVDPAAVSPPAADPDPDSVKQPLPEPPSGEAALTGQPARPEAENAQPATQKAENSHKRSARARRWGESPT